MPRSGMPPLYLDNAASTRIADDVLAAMTEVMRTAWGNPSAQHPQGAAARAHIETARRRLLVALGDSVGDSIGGSRSRTGSILTSTIEHPAVGVLAARLGESRRVIHVEPGPDGVLDPEAV